MQVIDDISSEVDKRVNDLITSHLPFILQEQDYYLESFSTARLKSNYANIISQYVKHKRAFKKAAYYELPNLQEKYLAYIKLDKLKEDSRKFLTEVGIDYKEIQKNLQNYLFFGQIID